MAAQSRSTRRPGDAGLGAGRFLDLAVDRRRMDQAAEGEEAGFLAVGSERRVERVERVVDEGHRNDVRVGAGGVVNHGVDVKRADAGAERRPLVALAAIEQEQRRGIAGADLLGGAVAARHEIERGDASQRRQQRVEDRLAARAHAADALSLTRSNAAMMSLRLASNAGSIAG
jgi:hypothetical protein